MAATRQRQGDLEGRMVKLAAESEDVAKLSETLKGKLQVLELERKAAYTAAKLAGAPCPVIPANPAPPFHCSLF